MSQDRGVDKGLTGPHNAGVITAATPLISYGVNVVNGARRYIKERSPLPEPTVDLIVSHTAERCMATGLNSEFVLAQQVLETDAYTSRKSLPPGRNPANIGVYAYTPGGQHFYSYYDGVDCHIGILLGHRYTDEAELSPEEEELIAFATGIRPALANLRGVANTVGDLPAKDVAYVTSIARVASVLASA